MAHKPTPDLNRVRWRKSSYSGVDSNCVEVAFLDGFTLLRDAKDPSGPVLTFTPAAWSAFVNGVQDGEFG